MQLLSKDKREKKKKKPKRKGEKTFTYPFDDASGSDLPKDDGKRRKKDRKEEMKITMARGGV